MAAKLDPLFSKRQQKVEAFLAGAVSAKSIPEHLASAMNYSLLAGGKRLRPVLCLTCAALCGADEEAVLPFASAIEMIHTYSLIHDDLPAMDNDDFRRGKPSCHKAFGEATALLAGDALLTDAFAVACQARVQAPYLVKALSELARAAGSSGMAGGQQLDMDATGKQDLDLQSLRALHAKKTGALLRAACTCGALLAGAESERYQRIASYGAELGVAFQIVDDILDEVADPAVLGKPVHSDRDQQKATYPALVGIEQSRILAKEHARQAVAALESFGDEAQLLVWLANYTLERVF
ncbi:MAG: polyprenyl synthetase family protein [Desulfovibrio sp.]|nr:polyprenyl synthetase family protein [Desulfovibrio sp.]